MTHYQELDQIRLQLAELVGVRLLAGLTARRPACERYVDKRASALASSLEGPNPGMRTQSGPGVRQLGAAVS